MLRQARQSSGRSGAENPRSYEDGAILPYLGRPLRLVVTRPDDGQRVVGQPRAALSEDFTSLTLRVLPSDDRRQVLLFWYTARTEEIVRALVPVWSKKIGVRPRLVDVKYARSRWGSCSHNRSIFLNSRLSMLSSDVAEYVVVHELCHLKHMNHSRAFWDEVESALHGSRGLRRKLREEERAAQL
jgi:predicted metal-dependent hydrolase